MWHLVTAILVIFVGNCQANQTCCRWDETVSDHLLGVFRLLQCLLLCNSTKITKRAINAQTLSCLIFGVHLHTINEVSRSRLSRVRARTEQTHIHKQTRPNTLPAAFACSNTVVYCIRPMLHTVKILGGFSHSVLITSEYERDSTFDDRLCTDIWRLCVPLATRSFLPVSCLGRCPWFRHVHVWETHIWTS